MITSSAQMLVHVDLSAHSPRRLELACQLASTHEMAVTALYAVTSALMQVPMAPGITPDFIASLREVDDSRRAGARATFDKRMAAPGVRAAWAEVAGYPVLPAFADQALYADLLVLGQRDPSAADESGIPPDFAESVMLMSGKPALVVPYAMPKSTPGQTIVIAWKATRESARAVAAAMPFLQRARAVHVVSWAAQEQARPVTGEGLDLKRYLGLHGVQFTHHDQGGEEPGALGELLLSRCADLDADMLVMGCYGHGRAREWVLGGTSRTILRSMTLPVLMAH